MELDKILSHSDALQPLMELSEQKKHEFHYVGSRKWVDGLTMFSFNTATHEIKKADIEYCKDIDFATLQPVARPKLVVERDCVYFQALNKKNFIKILKREGYL